MNRGCLGGLGRVTARIVLHLASLLGSLVLSGLSFLLFSVLGPLLLGLLREFALAVAGMPREGSQAEGRLIAGSPVTYAMLSGLAWVLVAALLALVRSPSLAMYPLLDLSGSQRTELLLSASAIFAVGAGVGLLVHRYQRGIRVE